MYPKENFWSLLIGNNVPLGDMDISRYLLGSSKGLAREWAWVMYPLVNKAYSVVGELDLLFRRCKIFLIRLKGFHLGLVSSSSAILDGSGSSIVQSECRFVAGAAVVGVKDSWFQG